MVMKVVVSEVLKQNDVIEGAASPYVDDILVNEDVVTSDVVISHLRQFGLQCNPAQRVMEGARILGLRVGGAGVLQWQRDNIVKEAPMTLTKRSVFSWCGQLVSHLPVCGWLRPAASFIKRKVTSLTRPWDNETDNTELQAMVDNVVQRVSLHDPARGRWDVSGTTATVWVDASSVALGVAVEVNDDIVEDACYLRQDESAHINMAEMDAALKGLNLAVAWGMTHISLMTDSVTVHRWISDTLTGKARVKTKAAGEMLIRRRLNTFKAVCEEYKLDVTLHRVSSAVNRADALTRVPQKWLTTLDQIEESPEGLRSDVACAAVCVEEQHRNIVKVHHDCGHPGIRRTLYFVRRVDPTIVRRQVQQVVSSCQVCRSVDLVPERWRDGVLAVKETWHRVGIDITHHASHSYLTLVDHGPSRFSVWRQLRLQTAACVVQQLESIFYERSAPHEILLDNDTAFHSKCFGSFAKEWGISLRFRCAYVASGNGIQFNSELLQMAPNYFQTPRIIALMIYEYKPNTLHT
ncbi:hypothetical protein Pmani_014414 [Petrolisthes manimaculis]|uniref:Integrase catalytic domain-containing protein n=1 Tax=Petrolisthes manimaculis TaxID=1843537 RepID=A0AAE1PVF8_9EUCA|nr:hypothetical protein Pmani_014414 [Petrolisthes manimaculis]